MSFPPYSVINGIRDFYRALLTWIVKTPKQSGNFLRDYVEYLVEHDISEEDFLIFGTTVTDIITPVSYTHLDVYKRQPVLVTKNGEADLVVMSFSASQKMVARYRLGQMLSEVDREIAQGKPMRDFEDTFAALL